MIATLKSSTQDDKPRVLMVSTFPPRRCGIGDYTADLALALSRSGRVHLRVLTYSDGLNPTTGQENGVELSRGLDNKPRVQSLVSEIAAFKPDLVHLQSSSFLHPPGVNRSIARACNVPLMITAHDTPRSWRVFYTIRSLRDLYRKSTRVLVHSPSTRRILTHFHGVENSKIMNLPHGVDVERYSPDARRDDALARYGLDGQRFVLFFGFLRPGKGLPTLLKAWARVEKTVPDATLVIAGGTPSKTRRYLFNLRNEADYPGQVMEHARSLGIGNRVRLTGYVADEHVPGLLASAAAIVLPYEGPYSQSGPLHKALGSGRPIIASSVLGSTELLEDGRTALLTPPNDTQALASALHRILTDHELAERLGHDARKMAEDRLSWAKLAHTTSDVYSLVIGKAFPNGA